MATLNIWYGWDGFNIWLFELAQRLRSPALEPALVLVSVIGSFWLAPYYGRVIGAQALHIVRCHDRHTIVGFQLKSSWEPVFFRYLLATVLAAALVWALKTSFDLPRPWELYGPGIGLAPLAVNSEGSFPSGHAAFTAVLVGSLWPRFSGRAARAMLVLLLVCVGLSRVLIGAHFPADVVAGYIVGVASVWISDRLLKRVETAWTQRLTNGHEEPEGRTRR